MKLINLIFICPVHYIHKSTQSHYMWTICQIILLSCLIYFLGRNQEGVVWAAVRDNRHHSPDYGLANRTYLWSGERNAVSLSHDSDQVRRNPFFALHVSNWKIIMDKQFIFHIPLLLVLGLGCPAPCIYRSIPRPWSNLGTVTDGGSIFGN